MRGKFKGCIAKNLVNDGYADCPDGSDEQQQFIKTVRCDSCNVTMRRLETIANCTDIGFPSCDDSTCYKVPSLLCSNRLKNCSKTDVICTSFCDDATSTYCKQSFQCSDGSLISTSQFCDGKIDCPDNSDEIRGNGGFKCTSSLQACTLPQINLHDSTKHCKDGSDLCLLNQSCFECIDKSFYISFSQVCDDRMDCLDASDECLCETNFNQNVCNVVDSTNPNYNPKNCTSDYRFEDTNAQKIPLLFSLLFRRNTNISSLRCQAKHGVVVATICDGRPECSDYSDECSCKDKPQFCNDICPSFIMMGDRYCDGIIDEAWMFINNSACPRGFDEMNCSSRIPCQAGDKISIDINKLCDEVEDCNDGSDESDELCPRFFSKDTSIFSSDIEMIANDGLRSAFWIIGFLVIAGNAYVITTNLIKNGCFKTTPSSASVHCNRILILNIAVADFIMGIYLITISIYSVVYSGRYKEIDLEWRTSLRCSVIGSLAVLSSEASCLLMVTLTSFRLYHVFRPLSSMTLSGWSWKVCIFISWIVAVFLAVMPILEIASDYFVHHLWVENVFSKSGEWSKCSFLKFTNRLYIFDVWSMSNSIDFYSPNDAILNIPSAFSINITSLNSALEYLNRFFPSYAPQGQFGYYSETSICMPRYFVTRENNAWEYSLAMISLNFTFFVFIAVSYILIYKRSMKQRPINSESEAKLRKQEVKMQKRIARIIVTDFACWIPICIIAFVKFGGINVGDMVYPITAVFLLPINSVLNPFLYTLPLGKWLAKLDCRQAD